MHYFGFYFLVCTLCTVYKNSNVTYFCLKNYVSKIKNYLAVTSLVLSGELVDDIDIPDAINFIVQPQTVTNNIAIATGYVSQLCIYNTVQPYSWARDNTAAPTCFRCGYYI